MAQLSGTELRQVYEMLVKPMNHPDSIGYMTRALLLSGGDPDYWGSEEKVGFMPVNPSLAFELTGVQDVTTLANNISATIIMDLMYYEAFGNVTDMVVAFTYGSDAVTIDGSYTGGIAAFLNDIEEMRPNVLRIVSPPRATVRDVLEMVKEQIQGRKPDKGALKVVNMILEKR